MAIKRKRFRDVPIISITVGNSQTSFHVHEDLLCSESHFFKDVLTKEPKEASNPALDLPDDDVDTFERFIQWIYSGECGVSGFGTPAAVDEAFFQLARLHKLANKLQVPRLKNHIIDKFVKLKEKTRRLPELSAISYIYQNSVPNSPLRKLMVDFYAWSVSEYQWQKKECVGDTLSGCLEFTVDLALAMARRLENFMYKSSNPFSNREQNYYEVVQDL